MATDLVRTPISAPRDLVEVVDRLVGKRNRSRFFTEAAEARLRKLNRSRLAEELAGSLKNVDVLGWETPESTFEWIRVSREADDERLRNLWAED
ncbi:MAG: hypothetical protein HY329_13760 [Chloroflexi bacterium]|nr:hypothetical protein [Chloroflexota bacterium]